MSAVLRTPEPDCVQTRPGLSPWAGLSLLLLVALTINAAAGVLHPALAELGNDSASQRLAVRLWTQSVSRSVQRLTKKQDERPALVASRQTKTVVYRAALAARVSTHAAPRIDPPRESLIALPPPAC